MQASDRLAVVTGTSRGIGAAVAAALLERDWDVVGVARQPAAFGHQRYRHVEFDLANARDLAGTLEGRLAPILADPNRRRVALVNNAADGGALGPFEHLDPVALASLGVVNWIAPAWLMGLMIRRVPSGAALRIVNVSSGAAVRPFPGLGDYCGSKAALRMMGMVAAAELDSALRNLPAPTDAAILSYEPGTVDTQMQEAARSRPLSEYPWGGLFRDFHARGALVPPTGPAAEIAEFLESDGHPRFSERRFKQ